MIDANAPTIAAMRCEVLYFAQARELAACDREPIDLPSGATVRAALAAIMAKHASLQSLSGRLAIAVDERYAPPDAPLRDGCVIALIPPVSGG